MSTEILLIPAAVLLILVLAALVVVGLRLLARWLLEDEPR